jgi:hypothetical protein
VPDDLPLLVSLEGHDLPGRTCGPSDDVPGGYRHVTVAVQRRAKPQELIGHTPGDAATAQWVLDCVARPGADGIDVSGPYVQGPRGGRFIYLSWGEYADGSFAMFRRAKLWLDTGVPDGVLRDAVAAGRLHGRLGLTDAAGGPLCASVRPPVITWTAG